MSGTKIKICGLTRAVDAEAVNLALPDYAGFVFTESSRRFIASPMARRLRALIRPEIVTVGVFVDAAIDEIKNICRENTVQIIQLHGAEDEGYIAALRKALPDTEVWKAIKIRSESDIEAAKFSTADKVILDNGSGSGELFDWSLLRAFARPFILAGGLSPENIPAAIARFHPFAVDLSSGVETEGMKDSEKITAAVLAVRRNG